MSNKWMAAAFFAVLAAVASAEITIEKQKELAAMRERATVVSRKKISVGGKEYIVEQWKNTPEGREWRTNEVFSVLGVKQHTSWSKVKAALKESLAAAELKAGEMKELKKAVKKAAKNISKVVNAIEKAKKKSSSDEETALYDALLALINGESE